MKRFIVLIFFAQSMLFNSSCKKKKIAATRPNHIIVVIEENHGYADIVGSPYAPYINQLAKQSAVFTDAHGVSHPSQPNYLVLFSGDTQGIPDDQCLKDKTPYTTPNLAAKLINKGYTFKGYAQSMPAPGYLECEDQVSPITGEIVYARKHVPWANWQGNETNGIPASLNQPMTAFPADFNDLPTVAFVIPDQDHDMHNINNAGDSAAIQRGDEWLKDNLNAYVNWANTHNSLLIVTYDEDDLTTNNQVLTFFIGQMVKPGTYTERIDHYNVLQTIEDFYDLPVTSTTNAPAIKDVWK